MVNNAGNWLLRLIYEGLLGWELRDGGRTRRTNVRKGMRRMYTMVAGVKVSGLTVVCGEKMAVDDGHELGD